MKLFDNNGPSLEFNSKGINFKPGSMKSNCKAKLSHSYRLNFNLVTIFSVNNGSLELLKFNQIYSKKLKFFIE
jgi:hypothetical protein